jgi:rhodanese-related sulfurtransferase
MNLITRDELRERLERGDELKLVMTLSPLAYRMKHIPTSIHFDTVDDALTALDPCDEVVVYCADVHCAASIYAYRILERAGFSRLRRYAGGIADWEDAGYPLEGEPLEQAALRPAETRRRERRAQRPSQPHARCHRPWVAYA